MSRTYTLILGMLIPCLTGLAFPLIGQEQAGKKKEITNSIGMKLVYIPPGKFTMGSPKTEKDRGNDENEHEVEITKGFYMGKFEVTIGEFRKFVQAEGHKTEAEKDGKGGSGFNESTGRFEFGKPKYTWKHTGWAQGENHPVVNMTWNDADAFCVWLSREEKKNYNLPTEAQWEYACRGGAKTAYYSGNDRETLAQVGNVADAAFRKKFPQYTWNIQASDGYVFMAPVGQFRANDFGLHDMHGNAWEWCKDWYAKDYYANSPPQDPPGPQNGTRRVVRGGSFSNFPKDFRSANRNSYTPDDRYDSSGFRVVLSVP